jgi:hypothetical protein
MDKKNIGNTLPAFVQYRKYLRKLSYKQLKLETGVLLGYLIAFEHYTPRSKNNLYYKLTRMKYAYALKLLKPCDKTKMEGLLEEGKQNKPSALMLNYEAKLKI